MKKVIINENQRGFLFKHGKYVKTLGAGKYLLAGDNAIELCDVESCIKCSRCTIDTLLADPDFAAQVVVTEVGDEQIVLHYVDKRFNEALCTHGKYAFWRDGHKHDFKTVQISEPEVEKGFPLYAIDRIPSRLYTKIEVPKYMVGLLYFDNRFVRILASGTYYFWNANTKASAALVDTRLTKEDIIGQEILTMDKVALRINIVCTYRVTDYVKVASEVDNYAEQLHIAAQLALREYVGQYKLDDILANKGEISKFVFDRLQEVSGDLYIEVKDAAVKDIILPGEIRSIMNTVLIAEKKAQANVITRREEVASTRSLLNTANLIAENPTLFKLKELEYVERICEHVGNINLNGNGDMLSQLVGVLGSRKAE